MVYIAPPKDKGGPKKKPGIACFYVRRLAWSLQDNNFPTAIACFQSFVTSELLEPNTDGRGLSFLREQGHPKMGNTIVRSWMSSPANRKCWPSLVSRAWCLCVGVVYSLAPGTRAHTAGNTCSPPPHALHTCCRLCGITVSFSSHKAATLIPR